MASSSTSGSQNPLPSVADRDFDEAAPEQPGSSPPPAFQENAGPSPESASTADGISVSDQNPFGLPGDSSVTFSEDTTALGAHEAGWFPNRQPLALHLGGQGQLVWPHGTTRCQLPAPRPAPQQNPRPGHRPGVSANSQAGVSAWGCFGGSMGRAPRALRTAAAAGRRT
jgi:hypothetical protein